MDMRRMYIIFAVLCIVIAGFSTLTSGGIAHANSVSVRSKAAVASPNTTYVGQVVPYLMPNKQKYCLGITGGSPYAYNWSTVWTCNNHKDQLWNLKIVSFYLAVTYFEIINVNSGLCLTPQSGTNAKSGDYLFQTPCIGTFTPSQPALNPQLFQRANPDPTLVNLYEVFNTTATIKGGGIVCLGIHGGKVYQGSDPILWDCNSNLDQLWYMPTLSN